MNNSLMFHGLGPIPGFIGEAEARYWLPTQTFARILEAVRAHPAEITFDDGNLSDVEIALPLLKEAGLAAAFFIPTDRIGLPGYVSEADIHTLQEAGMHVGSHGCAHIRWTQVSDEAVAQDVGRSIERLSAILGERVHTVAVPFGDCDLRVLRVLRRLGVGRVYTSFRGPSARDAWLVRRDCIMADMTQDTIQNLIARKYTKADAVLSFLRVWRKTGRAALWPAA